MIFSIKLGNNTVWVTIAMGAPIAVSMAEKLICDFNCESIIRIGTAGSLVNNIKLCEICASYAGIKGEGTSSYYISSEVPSVVNFDFFEKFIEFYKEKQLIIHPVLTYTTDGRWKENPLLINKYKLLGAKNIDMESSALLSMGMDKNVNVLSLNIISDFPLDDDDEHIGVIRTGVWDKYIMPNFIKLFSICLLWCQQTNTVK